MHRTIKVQQCNILVPYFEYMYKFKAVITHDIFIKKETLSMNKTLNKYLLAALLVAPLAISANAQAEEAAAEATPDWSLT
jgi:hypothetical protein